jgi:uncharacterized protein (TIRG00374 family)
MEMQGGASLRWGVVLRAAITVLILGYLALRLDWTELGRHLMSSQPLWLLTACVLFGVSFLLASVRWLLLLKVQEIVLPLRVVMALTFIGQFFNSFLLGTTGGDVIRTLYIIRYAPSKKTHAVLSILMDRAIGLFVLLCFAIGALRWPLGALMERQETRAVVSSLLLAFALVVAVGAVLALTPFSRLPEALHRLWEHVPGRQTIESLMAGFQKHGRALRLTLQAALCSVGIYVIVFTAGYCIALAINVQATYAQILVTLAIVICIISLPISIGGHGVREGAFVLMFAALGIITVDHHTGAGQEPAVLFSLLFYALLSVWSLVGGLIYLIFRHPDERRAFTDRAP